MDASRWAAHVTTGRTFAFALMPLPPRMDNSQVFRRGGIPLASVLRIRICARCFVTSSVPRRAQSRASLIALAAYLSRSWRRPTRTWREIAKMGSPWELLDPRMEEDEPGSVDLLQAAFKLTHGAAMMNHEMQGLQKLCAICVAESDLCRSAERGILFDVVRDEFRKTFPRSRS